MPLRLMTLGAPLELLGPGRQPLKFTNTKHLALLAYLILEPGDYPRSTLTKFVWSSGDAGSMNDALSSLRSVFGEEVFPRRAQRISFDASLVACDAAEFLALGAQLDDATAKRSSLALYRGPFFEDFNARGASTRYIKWVEEKRAELERTFIAVSDWECAKAAEDKRWADLAEVAGQAEKKAPAWEGARGWLEIARRGLLPPLPSAAHPEPAGKSTGTAEPKAGPTPHRSRRLAVLALVLVGVLAAGVWAWSQLRGGRSTGEQRPKASDGTVLCEPGKATAQLVDEVFFYGVRVQPGRPFAKGWKLQNTGECAWDTNFQFHHVSNSGPQLSSTMMDMPLRRLVPHGDTIWLVLPMRAPTTPGSYEEVWELRDSHDRPVLVGGKNELVAMIRVPLPHYPPCKPGEGAAALIAKKYPDGTVRPRGEDIRFSWSLKNGGECAWGLGAQLRYVSSSPGRLSREDSVIPNRSVEPGETYTFLVPMITPGEAGIYQEAWELRSGVGSVVQIDRLPTVTAQIRVQSPDVPLTMAPICPPGMAQLRFVDENWPDSSRLSPGQEFVKRWTVTNIGTCAWPADYRLRYVSSPNGQLSRSTAAHPLGEVVPPEAAYTFEVAMRAPRKPGFYREDWRFDDNRGNRIMIGTSPDLAALITVERR
jgi:hypothetical protein